MSDLRRYAQLQSFTLYGAGCSIGAISIVLTNFLDIDGTPLTMASFGTKGYCTIEPGNGMKEEQISFTGITQNGNGTATLTGIQHVLFVYPYTETSGVNVSHVGGVELVVSNTSGFYDNFANRNNNETITEVWTFENTDRPQLDVDVDATLDEQLITKGELLRAALGTVTTNQVIVAGTAGETVALNDIFYFDETDNEWKKALATTAALVNNTLLSISMGAGTNGNPITGGVLLLGYKAGLSGLVQGDVLYISDTGTISATPGTVTVKIGYAISATEMYFSPRYNSLLTNNQLLAIAGNNGTPGAANKLVTQTGFQRAQEIYAATSTGNDTYVLTLSPVPTAYVDGMEVRMKADVANTGAASLNVNSLGAITIVKGVGTTLQNNDIVANQICVLTYNSTGPVFQLASPTSPIQSIASTNGTTSKNAADASTTQVIPHSLGKIPTSVEIFCTRGGGFFDSGGTVPFATAFANAFYNGTTQSNQSMYAAGSGNNTQDTTFTLNVSNTTGTTVGTITFDATNINIAWVKTGSPTGTYNILWRAIG